MAGGVCLLFARLAGGLWRVRALRRAGRALPPSSWQATCDRLAHRLGLRRAVRVADVSFVDGPVVIGWLRPVVLLPIAAVAGLTPSQVEAILAHELAHVRRHDAVVNACQTVAETLLFYHPAVWWLSSRIRAEREHCCDDIALDDERRSVRLRGGARRARELARRQSAAGDGGHGRPAALARGAGARTAAAAGADRGRHDRGPGPVVRRRRGRAAVSRRASAGGGSRTPRRAPSPRAWRMLFDHPSGQMVIRGFTARDLVRYAYQLPLSRIVGGPAWLDTDAFELTTTLDHVPAADETPALVRNLLEERFGLRRARVHDQGAGAGARDRAARRRARAEPAAGDGRVLRSARVGGRGRSALAARTGGTHAFLRRVGRWDRLRARARHLDGRARGVDAAALRGLDVVNRTGLAGVVRRLARVLPPGGCADGLTPSLRLPLQAAGFQSVPEVLEEQLGLKLVPSTADAPAIVIDRIEMPTP